MKKVSSLEILLYEKRNNIKNGFYYLNQIAFAYNSNHIEGCRLTKEQTRHIYETSSFFSEKDGEEIKINDVIETRNHFKAFDFILEKNHEPITQDFLKELHRILKNGTSDDVIGDYKKTANYIGDFSTIKPKQVTQEIERLLSEYSIKTNIDIKDITIGKVSGLCGEAAYKYIERAVQDALQKDIDVGITAPINKEALNKGGYHYEGHTEILANLTNTKKYAMLLWSEKLSVVHVSTHCSLQDACKKVTKDRVLNVIELAGEFLQKLGIKNPRIAVAGLNPHSGEAGLFGAEEIEEIIPALKQAKKDNWEVEGPIPPDTVFLKAYKKEYDVVVAMYHDQGHIPIKLLAFDEGVNVTLGLPIIRTSVDHGTAFDIAGKGIANEKSILNALILGKKFF